MRNTEKKPRYVDSTASPFLFVFFWILERVRPAFSDHTPPCRFHDWTDTRHDVVEDVENANVIEQ